MVRNIVTPATNSVFNVMLLASKPKNFFKDTHNFIFLFLLLSLVHYLNFLSPVNPVSKRKPLKPRFFRLRLRLLCCVCMLFLVCKHTDKSLQTHTISLAGNNLKTGKTKKKNLECCDSFSIHIIIILFTLILKRGKIE